VERGGDEGGAETESDNCSENELPHLSLCAGVLHTQCSAIESGVNILIILVISRAPWAPNLDVALDIEMRALSWSARDYESPGFANASITSCFA
jgi:hypothetical protein